MPSDTWREHAFRALHEAHGQAVRAGLTGRELVKALDAAYPFGTRECWPYKAWLGARRKFFCQHGLGEFLRPVKAKANPEPEPFFNRGDE